MRTFPAPGVPPLILTCHPTSSVALGLATPPIPTLPLFHTKSAGEPDVSSVHCVRNARDDPLVHILAQLDDDCDRNCINASAVAPIAAHILKLVFPSTIFSLYAGAIVPIPTFQFP